MSSQRSPFYDTLMSSPVLTDQSSIKYAANDDAVKAFTVKLIDIATGKNGAVMPFRHVEFLRQSCRKLAEVTGEEHYKVMEEQFELLDKFSIIRNIRLMLKFNLLLLRKEKTTFVLSEEDLMLNDKLSVFMLKAKQLHIDVSGYLDESYDDDDIKGCDNDFCLNQKDTPGHAGDLITILRDADGCDHVLLIVRGNSPGKSQVALPGGFKEGKESAAQMCKRECEEETGYNSSGVTTQYYELTTVKSGNWDARPLFAKHGMICEGLLRFDIVTR